MTALDHFVRVYDDALPATFCRQTVAHFESEPDLQERNGGNVRGGLAESSWLERDFTQLTDFGFRNTIINAVRHYKARYEKDCGIRPALPEPRSLAPLIIKRYDPGGNDRFQPHFDSVGPVSSRYLVFLWYLNDVADGGETHFTDLQIKVPPREGRMLMFPPYWMYRHAGEAPVSDSKYILSTYSLW